MKTRILHTKVWKDEYFYNLDDKEKLAFLYLMTNENVNMIGIYELNDMEFQLWLKTTSDKINLIKEKFHNDRKFLFKDGWVCVINHNKYNSYGNGKQEKAYERELSLVPQHIMQFFNTSMDTSIDTSIYTNPKSEIINHKSEIRNKKEPKNNDVYKKIILHFNKIHGKNTKSFSSWRNNCDFWLETYAVADILEAISNWKYASGWLKSVEPDLTFLFRTRNKAGDVDYIDQLLNVKVPNFGFGDDDPLTRATKERIAREKKF